MDYSSVLGSLEDQKKQQSLTVKLYRFAGLIQAIEFFSQKMNLDQIVEAAFDFVNELLTTDKAAILIRSSDQMMIKKIKGQYGDIPNGIKIDQRLDELVLFHGTILREAATLRRYFDEDVLKSFEVHAAVPLIENEILYGVIFISHKAVGEMNQDDFIIAEALMRLINNAMENYSRYESLQVVNKELDEKIFNLFAINQSSKALLSELSVDVLNNLSVDVFSELTQSSLTGFAVYDERSERFRLKAWRDVFNRSAIPHIILTSNPVARVDLNRIMINLKEPADRRYFDTLFAEGCDGIEQLQAQYLVMLMKNNKILGFVSLGEPVTGKAYEKSIFELIESMASSTFIALNNAQLFKQVNDQRKAIQSKFDRMTAFNRLMRNINAAQTLEDLLDLTMKTLEISFGVEKALLCAWDEQKQLLRIERSLGCAVTKKDIRMNSDLQRLNEGAAVFQAHWEHASKNFNKLLQDEIGDGQFLLAVPVGLEREKWEMSHVLMIMEFGQKQIIDEERMMLMESVGNHIAPMVRCLIDAENRMKDMVPNYRKIFERDLHHFIEDAHQSATALQVGYFYAPIDGRFKENQFAEQLRKKYSHVYPVSCEQILVIEPGHELEQKAGKLKLPPGGHFRVLNWSSDFHHVKDFKQSIEG